MELVSSALAAVIGLSGIVIGFRLQDRSTARRDQDARQIQQRAELRQVAVQFLSKLAAMRRVQNRRSVLRETGAPAAEQETAKAAAMEARTAAGEALTELHLLTDDPHVLELAADVVDITFNLHDAPDRADRDRRADLARAAHNAFVAAARRLVRA
ncbi:hypothetical protein [Streptomyces prunicolor]